MLYLIYFWLVIAFVLMFWKPVWGCILYLPFYILVPYFNDISYFNYPIILALLFHYIKSRVKIDWRPFTPFVYYFICYLVVIPFQDGIETSLQFRYWRIDVVSIITFPLFISYTLKISPKSVKAICNVIIVCIIIACVYGLLLTSTQGINPYLIYMSQLFGNYDVSYITSYGLADGAGRLYGRIFSCFKHPMLFAYFLGLSIIYIYFVRSKYNFLWVLPVVVIVLLNILFCGVRSVIAAVIIATAFYLIVNRNYKLTLYIVLAYLFLLSISENIPYLNEYLGSFTKDADHTDIQGSSIEMRMNQFAGCLREIRDNFLLGKGYGWSANYIAQKGNHPTMIAFESLVFSVLCNSGIYGVFVWIGFVLIFLRNYSKGYKYSSLYLSVLVYYISYSIITGDYSYMKFFLLFLVIMLGDEKLKSKKRSSNDLIFKK